MLSDNGDPDFDVLALVPEWLRPNWEETVKQVMEDWDTCGDPVDPPPELLEYRRMADALEEPREVAVPGDRLVVDIPEAARMLSCGRTLIYELIRTRELRAVKIGRLTRIPTAALRELVERKLTDGAAEAESAKPGWWERVDWGRDDAER